MNLAPVHACVQALKEIYLPETGIWLSRYPYVARDVFLDISLAIEQERRADPDEATAD